MEATSTRMKSLKNNLAKNRQETFGKPLDRQLDDTDID